MNIKKITAFLLSLGMAASFASCSDTKVMPAGDNTENTVKSETEKLSKKGKNQITVWYDEVDITDADLSGAYPVAFYGDKAYYTKQADLYGIYNDDTETISYTANTVSGEIAIDEYGELLSGKTIISRDEKRIYFYERQEEKYNIGYYNISSGETAVQDIEAVRIEKMFTDREGNIYFTDTSNLYVYSSSLELKKKVELRPQLKKLDIENRFIYDMCVSAEGKVYLVISEKYVNHGIFYLDENDKITLFAPEITDLADYDNSCWIDKNGNIVLCTGYGTVLTDVISPETGITEYMYNLSGVEEILGPSESFDLIYLKSDGIYGYDYGSDSSELIVSEESFPMVSSCMKSAYVKGDEIFISLAEADTARIYVTDMKTGETAEYESQNCDLADVSADGTFYYVSSDHSIEGDDNGETYETVLTSVYRLENDGTSTLLFTLPQYRSETYPSDFITDKNNNFVFLYPEEDEWQNRIMTFDISGKILNVSEKPEGDNTDYGCLVKNEKSDICISSTHCDKLWMYDPDSMDAVSLPENISVSDEYDSLMNGTAGYDFYMRTVSGVSGCRVSEGITEELISWSDMDKIFDEYFCPLVINPDEILCTGGTRLVKADEKRLEELNSREIITLAVSGTEAIKPYVSRFNKENNSYRILLKDYSKYGTSYEWDGLDPDSENLSKDIINGDIPDIIMFDDMDMSAFIVKDIFTDLKEFIEHDPELDISDFYSNITDAFTYKGSLYTLPSVFSFETCYTAEKHERWDYDALTALADGENEVFEVSDADPSDLQYNLIDISDFVDIENRKCDFENEKFIKFIEFIKDNSIPYDPDNYPGEERPYSVMFEYTSGIYDYIYNISDDEWRQSVTPYASGLPSSEGGKIRINPHYLFGITKNSELKEGAWEFIRYFLSDDFDQDSSDFAYVYHTAYQGEYSRISLSDKAIKDAVSACSDYQDVIISDNDVNNYKALLSMPAYSELIYKQIRNIVSRELDNLYFYGDNDAESTAKSIQNKVSLYLGEIS